MRPLRMPFIARAGIARFALSLATLAAAVAGGACEAIVSDAIPPFTCGAAADSCPAGEICATTYGTCVDRAKACSFSGCGANEKCDEGAQTCVAQGAHGGLVADANASDSADAADAIGANADGSDDRRADASRGTGGTIPNDPPPTCRDIGCACVGPSGCASGICGDTLTLTQDATRAAGGNVCTSPCCTSTDCPLGAVCFGAGTGGNYCVRRELLGRSAARGEKAGGDACAASSDCRSGLCGAEGTCEDTCCSQSSPACAPQSACVLAPFAGASFDTHLTFRCASRQAGGEYKAECARATDCRSRVCENGRCGTPCRATSECGTGAACGNSAFKGAADLVATCEVSSASPPSPLGAACTGDSTCASLDCNDSTHTCSDVCFSDTDCKTAAGYKCRPTTFALQFGGMVTVLACVPG